MQPYKSEIARLEDKIRSLRELDNEQDSRKYVTCGKCKKKSQIRKVTYIQTHWYVRPYSCSGGGYWNPGEGQFVCPKCGIRNRLLSETSRQIAKLKEHFAEVKDQYSANWDPNFVNI